MNKSADYALGISNAQAREKCGVYWGFSGRSKALLL